MNGAAQWLWMLLAAAVGVVLLVIAWKVFTNLVKALFWLGIFALVVAVVVVATRGQF
ncbi:MAG TPA: hypothetical protein VMF06_12855 [Candidatus Limnocylindria bacterium]|jgi:hypothetical protein|nr:hypothetical protein [Candidatus Limnocylindria bacterium]